MVAWLRLVSQPLPRLCQEGLSLAWAACSSLGQGWLWVALLPTHLGMA